MSLDEAIQQMNDRINVVRMSEEEARLSVYAPAGDVQAIKDATFLPAIELLNNEGLDIQVFL